MSTAPLPRHARCSAPVLFQPERAVFLCTRCDREPRCPECRAPLHPSQAGWECRTCLAAVSKCAACVGVGMRRESDLLLTGCNACDASGEVLVRSGAEVGDER